MNKTTHSIFLVFHYMLMIRDTLEYTLEKKEFSVEVYQQRRQILTNMLDKPSPVSDFLKQNKEIGEKINEQLHEFIDDIYSDNSTIIRVGAEGLRVDSAQSIKIFNYVVGLYETFSDIVNGYLNYAKEQKQSEKDFENIVEFNNRFYRGISYMAIFRILKNTFKEYNDAMRESKGNPTPQSNFLSNDLQQLVGYLRFITEHNPFKDDAEINTFMEAADRCVKMIGGLEKPAEGENIFSTLDATYGVIQQYVANKEGQNNLNLQELFKDVAEFEKGMLNNTASEASQEN
ncbi:MAG: hypothetical protein HUJ61_04220 [Bacilli bacterium]|nr:hypothetical protein [Bacilli bacterium]